MPEPMIRLLVENIQPRPGRGGWHGGPSPVGALKGVSAREASWRPAPGRHTIWELALHIAYWKYAVRRRLGGGGPDFERSPANFPSQPDRPTEAAWTADKALLEREHRLLVRTMAKVPQGRLGRRPGGGRKWTYGETMLGIAMHDAYHVGQIQLMKRLWHDRRRLGAAAR
jgi:uncharacterized damage-inducible protein DinB